MNLTLKRIAKRPTYTIGKLYINNAYLCDTIEDTDRGLLQTMPLSMITAKKIKGQTAIPAGTYEVSMNVISPTYSKKKAYKWTGGVMPRLLDVPGWTGVLIHPGNTEKDSEGCIIVGRNTKVGMVTDSQATFKRLFPILRAASDRFEKIELTIC